MTTSVQAVDFTSFVFASNDDIKTTSLLVAEKFGKLHKDVLKKIESLECSSEFIERNFAPIEIDVKVGFGIKKSPAFEMTKDGFMFLVMGFTGKAAAQIKEAYINAFNLMHAKLFPKVIQHESPTITKAQYGELNALVCEIAPDGKNRMALWSRFNNHFRISSYKNLPTEKYDDALLYLEQKKVDYSATKEQPTATWSNHATMILTSHEDATYTIQYHKGISVIMKQPENVMIGTPENIIRDLKTMGYHVVKDDPQNKLETIAKIATTEFIA